MNLYIIAMAVGNLYTGSGVTERAAKLQAAQIAEADGNGVQILPFTCRQDELFICEARFIPRSLRFE